MKKSPIRITQLANGVRVISERMEHVRSVAVGIWIRSGSAYESLKTNGISHFVEHMLFKGTESRSAREIAQSLESVGGSLNASTGKELSVFTAMALDEYLPLAVDVLSDIVLHPLFSAKEIILEKKVVLTEINHVQEDPEEMVIDYLYQNVFYQHPLGYLIYGTPENVKKFNQLDLQQHLHDNYSPNRTVFSAAGNLDHDKFVEFVQRYYEYTRSQKCHVDEIQESDKSNQLFQKKQKSLHQAHISFGARTFGFRDPRRYALVLLEMLFGSGMSSRLFQNIREKYGFAYSVYSFVDFMNTTGVLGCYMACDNQKMDISLELLTNEFAKLRKNSITEKELEMVKSQAKGNIILGLESSARRMSRIAENEIYQAEHLSISEIINKVDKITYKDITELAKEFFDETKLVKCIIVPN